MEIFVSRSGIGISEFKMLIFFYVTLLTSIISRIVWLCQVYTTENLIKVKLSLCLTN
jgi:hypothetical protein